MSCSGHDLKAWVLGELDRGEQAACEKHISVCEACHEEAGRLKVTQSALFALPDEEIPQRIAFVSDKVFEPRLWRTIWQSGPAMGLAAAALLAVAILVHGYTRPAPVFSAHVDTAAMEQRIQTEVNNKVQKAVAQAVAAVETRQAAHDAQLLETVQQRFEFQRRADLIAARETINLYKNQVGRMMVAANYPRSEQ